MSLKIQIASDLHAEFRDHKDKYACIKPSADILALLGDICCVGSYDDFRLFQQFVNNLIPKYKMIIIVPGNHEYYFNPPVQSQKPTKLNTYSTCDKKLAKYCKTSEKLVLLNNKSILLTVKRKKYLIIGSVLWSHIPKEQHRKFQQMMSCYRSVYVKSSTGEIRRITPHETTKLFNRNVRFIAKELNKAKKLKAKAVVFTHHKPYVSNSRDEYSAAYESDVSKLFAKPLILWAYGHTHIADDRVISGVRFVSNPKGYPYQKTKFNPKFTITI